MNTHDADGGSAYPTHDADIGTDPRLQILTGGLSVRDRFAIAALPFCLREFGGNADDGKQYAEAAYQIADAMLTERAKAERST